MDFRVDFRVTIYYIDYDNHPNTCTGIFHAMNETDAKAKAIDFFFDPDERKMITQTFVSEI